jgi:Flp pilus assembly protein TadD
MSSDHVKMRRRDVRDLEDAGHPAAALLAVRRLLEVEPRDADALLLKGRLLASLCRHAEAEVALLQAQALFAAESEYVVHTELGHLYMSWGRVELALASYQKVAALRPSHAAGYIHAGAALTTLGRFEAAAAAHKQGTECAEGRIEEAHYNLGLVFRAQERFSEAQLCFEQAVALDLQYEQAKVALADVLLARATQQGEMSEPTHPPPATTG